MGSQTATWALPFPVGTDRVMDGDNALQALAERVDLLLGGTGGTGGGGAPAPNAPGMWQTVSGMTICTDTSLAAQAGSTVNYASWMRIGKTVWYMGYGGTGSAASTCGITLPNAVAGAPKKREYACGVVISTGTGQSDSQSGVGFMHANLDRLLVTLKTNGYASLPAASGVRWSVMYEVA